MSEKTYKGKFSGAYTNDRGYPYIAIDIGKDNDWRLEPSDDSVLGVAKAIPTGAEVALTAHKQDGKFWKFTSIRLAGASKPKPTDTGKGYSPKANGKVISFLAVFKSFTEADKIPLTEKGLEKAGNLIGPFINKLEAGGYFEVSSEPDDDGPPHEATDTQADAEASQEEVPF